MVDLKDDPFFSEDDHVVMLPDREELSDGLGTLSLEVRQWLVDQAPHTKWTYRRSGDDMRCVFKFVNETEALHFKMRWQG